MTDDLYERLRSADPVPHGVPIDPVTSTRSRALLEDVMSHTPSVAPDMASGADRRRTRFTRPVRAAVAVAAAVAAVAGGTVALTSGGGGTLALSVPGGATLSSCLQFDVDVLAQVPVAFAGTVTAVTDDTVALDVDRWFKGGDAETVEVASPPGFTSIALDGVEFVEGHRYLVSATNGTINSCGLSGPATPELERSFEEAFPG